MSLAKEAADKFALFSGETLKPSNVPEGVHNIGSLLTKRQKRQNMADLAKKLGLNPITGKRSLLN